MFHELCTVSVSIQDFSSNFLTANWLGNSRCFHYVYSVTNTPPYCFNYKIFACNRFLIIAAYYIAHSSRLSHCLRLSFERPVQIPHSMELICSDGPLPASAIHDVVDLLLNSPWPSHLLCSFGFLPFFLCAMRNQTWSSDSSWKRSSYPAFI